MVSALVLRGQVAFKPCTVEIAQQSVQENMPTPDKVHVCVYIGAQKTGCLQTLLSPSDQQSMQGRCSST